MQIEIRDVEHAICRRFDVGRAWLLSPARSRDITGPRQVAMYLSRELTGKSLPQIGLAFKRDHSSVLAAHKKISRLVASSPTVASYIKELSYQLRTAVTPSEIGEG